MKCTCWSRLYLRRKQKHCSTNNLLVPRVNETRMKRCFSFCDPEPGKPPHLRRKLPIFETPPRSIFGPDQRRTPHLWSSAPKIRPKIKQKTKDFLHKRRATLFSKMKIHYCSSSNCEEWIKLSSSTLSACRIQNPDLPRASRSRAAHGEAAGRGGAALRRTGRRRICYPRKQSFLLPSRASKTTVQNVSSEARTKKILCKPKRKTMNGWQ